MTSAVSPPPKDSLNLSNHFLIATPDIQGDMFEKSLIYLCQHSENGALGIMVNKPTDIPLKRLFQQVDLPLARADLQELSVLEGGPLHTERGFVLHERMRPLSAEPPSVNAKDEDEGEDSIYASTLLVAGSELELTTSTDIMHAIANDVPATLVLNVPNAGTIPELADDDVIETVCRIDASGIVPLPVSPLPDHARGMVVNQKFVERSVISAARTGSRRDALLALLQHPLVDSFGVAEQVLDEMIATFGDELAYLR